ncbi:hypothetical protein QR680_011803 [Steinernema hermaphroditum]|uniref:Protein kinase domain-containing protein n=1 Tax=Steinernema hermaphroditum TaxID=289476 RepID=A0AA39I1L2_9BILA|nr:hypothetical protein QR680_011803 [Steinernema hermaphroditum]
MATPPVTLTIGEVICSRSVRYTLERKLGDGRFGCVYEVKTERKERFAMKIEWKCAERVDPRLGMEILVLRHIRQNTVSPHYVDFVDRSSKPGYYFMVTTIVGPNLEELMRLRHNKKCTHQTALGVAFQVLAALKDLHGLGFIHRDIRPCNLNIGPGNRTHFIYLMNFGSAAVYRKARRVRKPRENVAFRGTMPFTSLSSHNKKEQCPKDDLESLVYTIVQMCNGLPWINEKNEDSVVAQKKKVREDSDTFFRVLHPPSMRAILTYLDKIGYYDLVDHDIVKNLILKAAENEKFESLKACDFDWEDDSDSSFSSTSMRERF